MKPKCDFSGYATKNDLKCSDGRTIRRDAFKHCDGQSVPLVWNHQHNDPYNVLGHAQLENRADGVYAYGFFNDSEAGQMAKTMVTHKDITSLSIYANQLQQQGGDVVHGTIREVSLVLAGANPGASIESVMVHGQESEDSGVIFTDDTLDLEHADTPDAAKPAKSDSPSASEKPAKPADNTDSEETVQQVIDGLTDKQRTVVYALIETAAEEAVASTNGDESGNGETGNPKPDSGSEPTPKPESKSTPSTSDTKNKNNKGGSSTMKHNLFESDRASGPVLIHNAEGHELSHSDIQSIFADAKHGSLKDAVLQHGVTNIDYLFPDARNINDVPGFITRDQAWVSTVISGTHHTPFSRIKSMYADLTPDDARAKGYIKGKQKLEEVFGLLKRTTSPTTVYKKQKMDRDDILDITDFDVVAWIKTEMRIMLNEELARAILVGDGRLASSDDHINDQNIRPIWTDDDLYTIKQDVSYASAATDDDKAHAFIRAAITSRKNYKGSGNPTLYITEDMLTSCLLLEDKMGRVIYDSIDKLATALRVTSIVSAPVLNGLSRTVDTKVRTLFGIIINLQDYNVGADKGGEINLFDDFDIDYNAQKYLIETRCSGALTVPYSAIALEGVVAAAG